MIIIRREFLSLEDVHKAMDAAEHLGLSYILGAIDYEVWELFICIDKVDEGAVLNADVVRALQVLVRWSPEEKGDEAGGIDNPS